MPDEDVKPCTQCGFDEVAGITVHDFKFNKEHDRIDWPFCPNCAFPYVMRNLNPDTIVRMGEIAGGDTFATHGDFYDEEGYAVQPAI